MYVVTMNRWGDPENHSYILGVFLWHKRAKSIGDLESRYRGGKYEAKITKHRIGETINYKKDFKIFAEDIGDQK